MPRLPRSLVLVCLLSVALLSGCATAPGRTTSDDPWQGLNRSIYKFNDALDRAAIKPVAQGYQKITPSWLRTGLNNFFSNLEMPWTMVNDLLQGKPQMMAQDTCRLVLNTVVGLGGFIDVADHYDLGEHKEDFGQTLAVWGVPSGPYLMLPFLGPSTVRDGFGRVPGYYGQPLRYAEIPWETKTALSVLDVVNTRTKLLSVEDALSQAYDKYGVTRDAWLQRREYLIYDGNPPELALDEGAEDMESAADSAADNSPATESPEPSEPSAAAEPTAPSAP